MARPTITHFDPAPDRLAPLRECMENYDVGDPNAEWPNNIISRKTVVYGSGVIAREGKPIRHNVDPEELALCKRLAEEACAIMDGTEVGMGSESSDPFYQFFIAANADDPVPDRIDEALIRSKFGGTIFPLATITVELLNEEGAWWSEVLYDASDYEAAEREEYLRPWRELVRWFHDQPELRDSAFVRIGEDRELWQLDKSQFPQGTEIVGCVLPRLVVGLTQNGSLVGLFGFTVQT